jgi:cell division protein FtsZ
VIELDNYFDHGARIRVVGVGGGGGNAITSMIDKRLQGVDFFAINTDMQALERNKAPNKIQIGKSVPWKKTATKSRARLQAVI